MLKKVFFASFLLGIIVVATSCGVKKDCWGNKHYRDKKTGIYI